MEIVLLYWSDVLDEAAFANKFEKTYFRDASGNTYWSHWWVGAAGENGGIDPNQNGAENGHLVIKVVLTAKMLRATARSFLDHSMPTIMVNTNRKIGANMQKTPTPRYRGEGPNHDGQALMNAKFLMDMSPGPWFLEESRASEKGTRVLIVTCDDKKMTPVKKASFMATASGKEPARMPNLARCSL